MIKFIKKHKLNFICYLFCAFAMALFTIISFSSKTYAYTIDENGNYVSQNLLKDDLSNLDIHSNSSQINNVSNYSITYTINEDNSNSTGVYFILSRNFTTNNIYSFSFDLAATDNITLVVYGMENNIITDNELTTYKHFSSTFNLNNQAYIIYTKGGIGTQVKLSNLMLNEGETPLPFEPYGVWYSSSNYQTLENQLNTTNGLLDLQIDITKYGWLSYIDNLEYYVTGNYVQTFSFNDLKTNNYISNNATLDLYQLSLYQNPNYSYIKFDIYFQNSYSNLDYFSANLFDISTKLGFNGVVSIYDTDSNSAIFNIVDIASITYEDIIEKNSNFGDYIYNVTFEFASPDAATMIYTNSFYSRGYQTGYSYGSNVSTGYYTPIINDLNTRISNLENNIVSLNNTIDTLKELNAQYQQQLADNVGWSSLFFAFADTPFKVVSNVLGFELFGLNLFATFIGMITVFGVVYLLKKFL